MLLLLQRFQHFYYLYNMKQLIDFFQDKRVNTLLDVGTGTGDFLTVLKEIFPEASITGIDPDVESLSIARRNHPKVNFREMKAESLDFEADSFDLISISMALHHLPDTNIALREMQRVVKPNGWLLISELFSDNLNPAQEVHKFYHHFRSAIHRILGVSHNETFTKNEILEMIQNAGVEILLHFDYIPKAQTTTAAGIEERVQKMNELLELINQYPQYEKMKPQVEIFHEKALKFGFQPATKVVVIGRKNG